MSELILKEASTEKVSAFSRFFRQIWEFLCRLLTDGSTAIGFIIVLSVSLLAIFAPLVAPMNPMKMVVADRLMPPSVEHPFGTDLFGRDLLSRVIYGARVSLRVAATVTFFTTIIGLLIGTIAGFYRRVDNFLMRIMDALMSFPAILLALAIMATLGRSEANVILALTIVYIPRIARLVRGSVLSARENDYVQAARAIGGSDARILIHHILPSAWATVVVQAIFIFIYAILAAAGLSFLGAGTPPSVPSWGNIIAEGRNYMVSAPWIMISGGLAISVTVLGLNLLGDGLRDNLDPRLQ